MKSSLHLRKCISLITVIVLVLSLAGDVFAVQKNEDAVDREQVVRVGYIDYAGFIEEDTDGSYSGYGVEYLEEIAKYTNFKYEYIYGTWSECMAMLENHEIDLLCTAKRTEEREEKFDFSRYAIGVEQAVLYTLPENSDLYYEDFEALDGSNIAFLNGSLNIQFFADYAKRNDFEFNKIEYSTDKEMVAALNSGKVDAIATEHMSIHNNLKLIGRYGSEPYYLMTYKNNSIMNEINYALSEIFSKDAKFSSELYDKYYGQTNIQRIPIFTRQEMEYIKEAPVFRVAVNSSLKPIAYNDEKTGKLTGINPAILDRISEISGLKFQYVELAGVSSKYTYDYFRDNKISLISGIEVNKFNENIDGLVLTNKYFTSQKTLVGRQGEFISSDDNLTIAIVGGSGTLPYVLNETFPNFKIQKYTTVEECLEAVKKKDADVLMYNQYIIEQYLGRPQYQELRLVPGIHIEESFAISPVIYSDRDGIANPLLSDPRLISILNKSIDTLTQKEMEEIVIEHTIGQAKNFSLGDMLYKYRGPFTALLGMILICIGLFMFITIN